MGRYDAKEFRLGDFWLGQRGESPAYYRCWREGGRERRASLGTANFETAKEKLTEWFIQNRTLDRETPDDVPLAEILRRYYEEHASKLRTAKVSQIGLGQWLDHWGTATVGDLSDVRKQEAFHAALRKRGLAESSVMRVITMGKAAVNRAFKRGELKSVPHILTVKVPDAEPMGRVMSVDELKALYTNSPPHLQIFIFWMLGTLARPEAIFELRDTQIRDGLISLNPAGRTQTKKYRPQVLLIPSLAKCVFTGHLIIERGFPVKSVKKAWAGARTAAGLDNRCTPYSLRHTGAQWLRRSRVPEWDVQTQLGHRRPGTTEVYTAFHPDYLKDAGEALEKLVSQVCNPLPVRSVRIIKRPNRQYEREGWWAVLGLNQ